MEKWFPYVQHHLFFFQDLFFRPALFSLSLVMIHPLNSVALHLSFQVLLKVYVNRG
jgi:hypothetical protein